MLTHANSNKNSQFSTIGESLGDFVFSFLVTRQATFVLPFYFINLFGKKEDGDERTAALTLQELSCIVDIQLNSWNNKN